LSVDQWKALLMTETSATLLERLHDPSDDDAWRRLLALYGPLIRGWLVRHGLPQQDVEDVAQDVLAVVARKASGFRRDDQQGAFRSWLRAIAVNCLREHWKRQKRAAIPAGAAGPLADMIDQLADPASVLTQNWNQEHDRYVAARLLAAIRDQFAPTTWQAFERVAVRGESADDVARELNITVNAVFIAKSRVLARLRQEGAGLID
jgi:RNA polymerase sigma-70 factor (ECF subfamily)